jgi:NADH dehydrogenase FAD-containing subunit
VQASFDSFIEPDFYSANVTRVNGKTSKLTFRASVVSVGATPQSTLASIPGAAEYTQPFYTRQNAQETKLMLEKMDRRVRSGLKPRIAIVGGGYGGVELSACVKRRLRDCDVTLLTRGSPMKGTRAEPLVDKALSRLGVKVEICAVKAVEKLEFAPDDIPKDKVKIVRTSMDDEATPIDDNHNWDAVLWTAGSGPAYPVCDGIQGLKQVEGSGRLEIDSTLRCFREESTGTSRRPPVWALGDCSQIVDATGAFRKGSDIHHIVGFTQQVISSFSL